tara:strand:+ start:1285 stop:1896 length:612 start_codon:yes stop_codon:yes gene_type:complete
VSQHALSFNHTPDLEKGSSKCGLKPPSGVKMTNKPKKNPLATLMALPGVGKATAMKLSDAGIKSSSGIVKAGQKGLIKAGLSAVISKRLLSAVSKKSPAKKADSKKPSKTAVAKNAATKAKAAAKKTATKAKTAAKNTTTKAKAAAKKAASKATASGRKVAEKTVNRTGGSLKVKTSKSTDGRKGKTLKVPRTVKDMAWFRKE